MTQRIYQGHPTIQLYLKQASLQLTAAQDLTELNPKEYSEHTWSLLTDALAIISDLETRTHQEENTHPTDR